MLNKSFSRIKIALALVPISMMLGSCRNDDLKTAEQFGLLSAGLEAANTKVSADIYNSCVRTASWFSQGTFKSRERMQEQLKVCDELYRPNAGRANIAGGVLVNYVKSVGELATEDTAGFNQQFTKIGEALAKLEFSTSTGTAKLEQNTINTGVKIATFLTNLILGDFQRRNLKAAIVCTDADIQTYADGLADFFDKYYVNDLLDEEIDKISEHYGFYGTRLNNIVNALFDNSGDPQIFASLQEKQMKLEQDERAEIDKVVIKKNEGAAYVTAIQTTAEFHTKLKRIFNNDKDQPSRQQQSKCQKFFKQNNSSRTASDKIRPTALLSQDLSPSELAQVRKVAKEYISEVSPLLAAINQKSE